MPEPVAAAPVTEVLTDSNRLGGSEYANQFSRQRLMKCIAEGRQVLNTLVNQAGRGTLKPLAERQAELVQGMAPGMKSLLERYPIPPGPTPAIFNAA